ncbi:MAG TPA: tetratricopeptide repeat protein [Xanthomonadales bacterium]|nr:tetratricopeptide repeat protein [Xanthomonadales bacterium]
MVEIYDAHEQGEIVKKWLQQNGSAIVMGLVLAFGGLFGFKQWQVWQDTKGQKSFAEFEVMNEHLSAGQLDTAMDSFQVLQENHANSPYASLAALQMARARIESKQADLAITNLRNVMENGRPEGLKVVARERLARLLLDQGQAEEALAVIDGAEVPEGYEARFAETRGDILVVLGRNDDAIAAYQQALDTLEEGLGDRAFLVLKLESLGVIQEDEASTS